MRCVKVTCQPVIDCTRSLPLEDRHLRTVEVHQEGWYADAALEQVGELAPAIFDFLEQMLIGQKVLISDAQGHECGAKV